MSDQAPQQSPPQHTIGLQRSLTALMATLLRVIQFYPRVSLSVGLGLPVILLLALLHPQSPFKTTLDVMTGGANIDEPDRTIPAPSPPIQFKPAANPQLLALSLDDQPTVDSPLQGFCHPLWGKGWISQGIRGVTHNGRMEYAYDYAAGIGTPVYAMRAGRVISIQDKYPDRGGGKEQIHRFNHVWLEHDQGYRSAYVHLQQGFQQRMNLKVGDQVKAGQIIGYSGNSGWSTGPHLHVEVHRADERFRFTQTVPFAISSSCNLGRQATDLTAKSPTVEDSQ
ncbi:M23 family metallopeptidase [Acaryochloris sp. IP29b_bin.148]|uniref:M23 family metallopeptidase n=1 Tax=Acaryochloris sp. IP29b_bin.148 TaxID=2969218 RepID=UPI002605E396|nr:M23 family metallopeptidase [Acaryochloris sp. IP29b_bin.148]